MKRKVWGVILILLGVLATLQVAQVQDFGLTFWSVVLTLLGLAIVWGSVSKVRISWFGLVLGLWVGAIGLFDILHNAGVFTEWDGGDVAGLGLPVLLIGLGLAITFGGRFFRIGKFRIKGAHHYRMVGDLRFGQKGNWVLDKDLVLEHGIGDVKLDLSTAQITEGLHHIRVSQTIGETVIRVPDNVSVTVHAEVSVGEVTVFSDHRDGLGLTLDKRIDVPGAKAELRIDALQKIGSLRVVQVPAPPEPVSVPPEPPSHAAGAQE